MGKILYDIRAVGAGLTGPLAPGGDTRLSQLHESAFVLWVPALEVNR